LSKARVEGLWPQRSESACARPTGLRQAQSDPSTSSGRAVFLPPPGSLSEMDGKLDTRLVYDAVGDVKAREPLPK